MSALANQVAEYLALRRSFGFALKREEQLPGQFVAYLGAAGAETVRSELAIAWAQLPATASPDHWAKRLGIVRRFAVYLRTIDDTVEVPPPGVFPATRCRLTPYLFSERDIERVLEAARALVPPLRAASHEALFGLLAASGMRIGEAIGLARSDVDLDAGVITIRHAKFDRTRLVPLHESSTARCAPMPPSETGSVQGRVQASSSARASALPSIAAAAIRPSGRSRRRSACAPPRCVRACTISATALPCARSSTGSARR
jgi:integrase/recombinase XerD